MRKCRIERQKACEKSTANKATRERILSAMLLAQITAVCRGLEVCVIVFLSRLLHFSVCYMYPDWAIVFKISLHHTMGLSVRCSANLFEMMSYTDGIS